jgi:hypothetical protein
MKMRTGLLAVAVGALVIASAYADMTTDQAAAQAPATNGQGATIKLPDGKEIPKELAQKLTGDQIVKLLKPMNNPDIPSLAPLMMAIPFTFIITLVALKAFTQHRRDAMLHQTMATMLEKGVPIPPELLQPTEPAKPKRSNLQRGLVLCGAGIGLILFLGVFKGFSHNGLWAVGFIPLFVGIARLIAWKLEQGKPNS